MKVLIATANKDLVLTMDNKLKFEPHTQNTCIFSVSPKKFEAIKKKARELGYNCFSLFAW